jgi:hypothetical protein
MKPDNRIPSDYPAVFALDIKYSAFFRTFLSNKFNINELTSNDLYELEQS